MWPQQDLKVMMDGFLTRPHERDLFGLDSSDGAISNGKAADKAKSDKRTGEAKPSARTGEGQLQSLPEKSVDVANEFNL
jgi:hypothetical protein